MPLPKSIGAYQDCRQIWDLALKHNGLRYELPTEKAAAHFRHRCYALRRLLQQQNFYLFDHLGILLHENTLIFVPREDAVTQGKISTLNGEAVQIRHEEISSPEPDDELERAARAYRSSLGLR